MYIFKNVFIFGHVFAEMNENGVFVRYVANELILKL